MELLQIWIGSLHCFHHPAVIGQSSYFQLVFVLRHPIENRSITTGHYPNMRWLFKMAGTWEFSNKNSSIHTIKWDQP